jgi:hypothetical protein
MLVRNAYRSHSLRHALVAVAAFFYTIGSANEASAAGAVKPVHTDVGPQFLADMITVKFRDGRTVRVNNGRLTDHGTGALNGAAAVLASLERGVWERTHTLDVERLAAMCERAAQNTGKAMPDLNLQMNLRLPAGMDAAAAIDLLNALDIVEMAQPIPAAVTTAAPDFVPNQVYRRTTPVGLGTERIRGLDGSDGAAVRIADIEFSWNLAHQDLPAVTVLGSGYDPFNDKNHGTAVLPCPPSCLADVTGDCVVNINDLLAAINGWGMCP